MMVAALILSLRMANQMIMLLRYCICREPAKRIIFIIAVLESEVWPVSKAVARAEDLHLTGGIHRLTFRRYRNLLKYW